MHIQVYLYMYMTVHSFISNFTKRLDFFQTKIWVTAPMQHQNQWCWCCRGAVTLIFIWKKNKSFCNIKYKAMYSHFEQRHKKYKCAYAYIFFVLYFLMLLKMPVHSFILILQNDFLFCSNENLRHGAHATSKSLMLMLHGRRDPDFDLKNKSFCKTK